MQQVAANVSDQLANTRRRQGDGDKRVRQAYHDSQIAEVIASLRLGVEPGLHDRFEEVPDIPRVLLVAQVEDVDEVIDVCLQ